MFNLSMINKNIFLLVKKKLHKANYNIHSFK